MTRGLRNAARSRVAATPRCVARSRAGRSLVLLVLLAAALFLVGCDKGQATDSSANSAVLRTTRLAGYPAAQVGVDRARAAVSLVLPSVTSAADIELAWQTGMAVLTETYPTSPLYRVVIRTPDRALLSAEAVGSAVVEAVGKDDPTSLKDLTTFTLLADIADPSELLPDESTSTTGHAAELDAANRAAGLETTAGPAVTGAEALAAAWKRAYTRTHGVPAPTGGAVEAAAFASNRIKMALKRHSIDGDRALQKLVPKLVAAKNVEALRQWAATTEAVASKVSLASVLELTAAATRAVKASAPVGALQSGPVSALERLASLDVTATASAIATGFVAETLAKYGVQQGGRRGLAYHAAGASGGETVAAPEVWLAYRAPGGIVYWLAGKGATVALTDTSLRGWGYQIPSATLVEAADVSRVVAVFSRGSG